MKYNYPASFWKAERIFKNLFLWFFVILNKNCSGKSLISNETAEEDRKINCGGNALLRKSYKWRFNFNVNNPSVMSWQCLDVTWERTTNWAIGPFLYKVLILLSRRNWNNSVVPTALIVKSSHSAKNGPLQTVRNQRKLRLAPVSSDKILLRIILFVISNKIKPK